MNEAYQDNEVYQDIEQHIPHLRRYARAITHNPVAADDLVQECLLRALAKSHLFRPGTNLRAWLFTILHNQFVSQRRRVGRTGVEIDPDDAAQALSTRPNQETNLVLDSVEKALRTLPDGQWILLELVALDGLSYEEAARRLDLPVGTVKSRISRGRSMLRDALEGTKPARAPAAHRAPKRDEGISVRQH